MIKVANGVVMLEIAATVMGKPSTIYPTLLYDNDTAILVDTGFPGQFPLLKQAVHEAGVPMDKLKLVLLTHQDIDHIGNLVSLRQELPGLQILAHEVEKPYIEGENTPVKLAQMEAKLNSLPENMQGLYQVLKAGFANAKTPVDQGLVDKQELPYCGGIEIVFTPGHTPGHICLYLQQSKTLISGDALGIDQGVLIKPTGFSDYDADLSKKSLQKLTGYDIQQVICYHGGLYTEKVNQALAELIAE